MENTVESRQHLEELHEIAMELERLTKEFEKTYFYSTGDYYLSNISFLRNSSTIA